MAFVQTTDGVHTAGKVPHQPDAFTREQAEASAAERNQRAEALGITTRYEAVGD